MYLFCVLEKFRKFKIYIKGNIIKLCFLINIICNFMLVEFSIGQSLNLFNQCKKYKRRKLVGYVIISDGEDCVIIIVKFILKFYLYVLLIVNDMVIWLL